MIWKARFKGEYLTAVEFDGRTPTFTIDKVENVDLEQEDGRKKPKAVIKFRETPRGWVFCKTTGFCLAAMFGDEDNNWVGKRVTLHSEMVQVGSEKMPGIRVSGSPDIEKPIKVSIKLPKKKAFIVTLTPTKKGAKAAPAPVPADGPIDLDAPPADHWDAVDAEVG